jgi:hypothetical protein
MIGCISRSHCKVAHGLEVWRMKEKCGSGRRRKSGSGCGCVGEMHPLHHISSWLNTGGNPCTERTSLRLVLVYALYDIYPIIRNDLASHILSTEQTSFDLSSTSIDTLMAIVAIVLGFPSDTSSRLSSFLFRQTSVWIFGFSGQSTTHSYSTRTRTKSPRSKGSLMKPVLEHDYSVNQSPESKMWHLSRMFHMDFATPPPHIAESLDSAGQMPGVVYY